MPSIAIQVLDLAQKAEVDIAEIARIISKDPALSGKILRTVNSSFYGRSQHVATVSHALVILGLQSVKTLVLGFSLVTNLSRNKSKGFSHVNYWKRSIYAATAARIIAIKINLVQQEEAFLGALLKDIGMLVLDQLLGAPYGEICEKAPTHEELAAVETQALGNNHAEVGGILAEHWKLPPILAVPVAFSHNVDAVPDPALRKMAELLELAGRCADVFVEESAAPAIAAVRQLAAARYKFSESDCDSLLNEVGQRTKEVATLFEINVGAAANFESILKKANEALIEITLQSQQQASALVEQNQTLKQQATTDGLTGLNNRVSFDQFLAHRFAAANSAQKPISLLMLDVDHFKKVNDQFGHPAGDQVLRVLGALLKAAARAGDMACRYGGEEMTLILPETPRATAAAVAEAIRRAIGTKPIPFEKRMVPVTVSIGVATFEPGGPLKTPAHLLKAADLAVYAAKNGGRNCVKVFTTAPEPKTAVA